MITGDGFEGFYATRNLECTPPPHSARTTLVNDVNFVLYASPQGVKKPPYTAKII